MESLVSVGRMVYCLTLFHVAFHLAESVTIGGSAQYKVAKIMIYMGKVFFFFLFEKINKINR